MDARTSAVVEARGLGKSFGRTVVLRDLDLCVVAGESLVIFGPNGAGKSTLLRLCSTLQRPDRGSLSLFGTTEGGAGVRRRIGLLGHQSFLYPDLSARENLEFFARMYRLGDPERCASAWLARVALESAGTRPVRVFSRGMEQRLGLARALLHDPELILLDEPWSGLDAEAADLLSALLQGLRRERRTLIVATHDFERGATVADRALILHGGRIAWATSAGEAPRALDAIYRRITGAVAA